VNTVLLFDAPQCIKLKLKLEVKAEQSPRRELDLELWGVTCHMGSQIVTYHLTQVKTPALTPASKLVLNLPTPEGWKAELT